ncbi:phage major capsid protein, partial [Escherichia coli]
MELRQQKTAIKNQMRDMLENAEKENRSLNDAEGATFDELRAKAESLDKDISRLEAIADEERSKPGKSSQTTDPAELRNYILTGETRALSTGVPADGGYTVIP